MTTPAHTPETEPSLQALNQCPFCRPKDSSPEIQDEYALDSRGFAAGWANVRCGNCGTHGPTTAVDSHHGMRPKEMQQRAVDDWNRRAIPAPESALRLAVEALERAAETFEGYVNLHHGKNTPDGDAKARVNQIEADACRAAIFDLTPKEPTEIA